MKIKQQSGWIPYGREADMANRLLTGNGARLFSYLYVRASRPSGQLDLRYGDVASALERCKRAIGDDFTELKEKKVCRVDSAVNQHSLVHVEICDEFWPFAKEKPGESDAAMAYISKIRVLMEARACIMCDFGPADEKFALELFVNGTSIEKIDRAIRLGCARKYQSLLNEREDKPIRRLGYFREIIEETGEADPRYWDRCIDFEMEKMESRWRKKQEAASLDSASARRKSEMQTG